MNDLTNCKIEPLRQDGEFALARVARPNGRPSSFLVSPVLEQPAPSTLAKLENAFALREELDTSWAARPVELVKFGGRPALVIEDPGGQFLDELTAGPLAVPDSLRLAIGMARALGSLHARGLVHKDVKPANLIANARTGEVWLTGFGLTSRLPRQRQAPEPPEIIAGTLAYMAPEQTGRMNRSIDSRSDLYSLGVTFYEMCVGELPFTASDPMEWVHCHIARLPIAPHLRRSDIPKPLSAIILKLLAKAPEERYQTAAGLEADLRHCRAALEARGQIEPFSLGAGDVPDRLLVPEKLYGREKEIELLLAAFDRVVRQGTPELVLVSGYSGVGKSSVVNELHKVLVPPRGLFASGKFDQYKRDIPYATLAQAFQGLIRQILGNSDAEVARWREPLSDALGPNAQLLVNLIPEIELIIGTPPPVPDLPPQEAKNRFQRVLRRFIGVFARPEHPLALFLDDLQWLDVATLDLLEDLLTQSDVSHLMLLGAYRDNEADPSHPLISRLEMIRRAGATVHEIVLEPLRYEDLEHLLADSLHCKIEYAAPLAQLVRAKTGGNPFFAIQFISALAEEGLLEFDHDKRRWLWDLNKILAKGYTDNVVDLIVWKLNRLPSKTQEALQQLACLGNGAEFDLVEKIYQNANEDIHDDLAEAIRAGVLFRSEHAYRFLHDRVQEAAYSVIPEDARGATHLRIGRLLVSRIKPADIEEKIFEIVNQLNRGSCLVTSAAERTRIAELNLIAARRAKLSIAYASALSYLVTGRELLTENSWNTDYQLVFSIERLIAECELLTADMKSAERRLSALAPRANSAHDLALITCLQLRLYTALDRLDQGINICLDYLRRDGMCWSAHPTSDEVRREYDRIWSQLENRQIEGLIDLPLMTDLQALDILDVLTEIVNTALHADENLSSLVICHMVNLSIERGNSDASCFAYVWFAIIAGARFGNYKDGFRFGCLGYELVQKRELKRFEARTYMSFGNLVIPWAKHARSGRDLIFRAFDIANRVGDLTYAAYCCDSLNSNSLTIGDQLPEVQSQAEKGLAFAKKARFGFVVDLISVQVALVRNLRGLTRSFGSFDHEEFDETQFEQHLKTNPVFALPECWYFARKAQARFLARDYHTAITASSKGQLLAWTSPSQFERVELYYYSALSLAAWWDEFSHDQKQEHLHSLVSHRTRFEEWAENCPENFENRAALVGGEIARIEGRDVDAMRLYEKAIRSAHMNGFIHNEAVAYEVAARFYAARGVESITDAYLRNARDCYLRWGADGKVQQLDRLYPHLAAPEGPNAAALNATIGAPVGQLDAETVARASQALSSEIVLPKLIERLMRIALEHAGAERGLLILLRGSEPLIEAEATTGHGRVDVQVRQAEITSADLPQSALQYVIRTRERVVLGDAAGRNPYSDDAYLAQRNAKSVLCLPIVKQTQLIGVLYLENNLTAHVFTSDRVAVLEMLASQAAISLENARLYAELEQENLERRRAEDALKKSEAFLAEGQRISHTGSWAWNLATDRVVWSEEHCRIFGYNLDQVGGTFAAALERLRPEERPALLATVGEAVRAGRSFSCEYQIVLPDGSIKYVQSVGRGVVNQLGNVSEYIGTTVDITERKRAEEELRRNEAALREAQAELAHVARVTTMGELAASIAHEVNQPIAGVVINGTACLRWLSGLKDDSANLTEARETLERIIRDGKRAGEIVARIRALFKKTESAKEPLDLNETIEEVIVLVRSEMNKQQVVLRLELSSDLPSVLGDRVQLQQVMLNLTLNAIDAMATIEDRARDLVVQTQSRGEAEVLVTVCDSGPGLDPGAMEQIFTAFHTTKPGGLGMGLSISRSIVANHSGRLWVTANEGPGASFHFTLQRAT